jgi:hypothetical protein
MELEIMGFVMSVKFSFSVIMEKKNKNPEMKYKIKAGLPSFM